MTAYARTISALRDHPKKWLVTGCAGFIGSHLVETLLRLNQTVVGLDNFSSGSEQALKQVELLVDSAQWSRFELLSGDIRDSSLCRQACAGVDYVLHHAALASVPESIRSPLEANESNVGGFLNMLVAARDAAARRFVFASSSAVYGDHGTMPTPECAEGVPLSPYAAAKRANELYAAAFAAAYGFSSVSLRYFNCFGGRQRSDSPYAAVIPIWLAAIVDNRPVAIFGDGSSTRDYVHIADVMQANILAAVNGTSGKTGIYNIGSGKRTALTELYSTLYRVAKGGDRDSAPVPEFLAERLGDIRHSAGDISKAKDELGYTPQVALEPGLKEMFNAFSDAHEQTR